VNDSPGINSSLSQEPEYHLGVRSDRHAGPWRIEDRRTADFRDEPRFYTNAGAGNGNRYIRVDLWMHELLHSFHAATRFMLENTNARAGVGEGGKKRT